MTTIYCQRDTIYDKLTVNEEKQLCYEKLLFRIVKKMYGIYKINFTYFYTHLELSFFKN